jgi:hypothetical protein
MLAVGVALWLWAGGAHAQTVTADRVELAPTGGGLSGFVLQGNEALLHTWDPGAPGGQSSNLFLGRSAGGVFDLDANVGRHNTALGALVMRDLTTGWSNTGVGYAALLYLRGGSSNTAVGDSTLIYNSGNSNSAVGASSLTFNTTGSYNAAVGGLHQNTTGSYNTAVGVNSLFQSTTGGGNTALGFAALLGNRFGSSNMALGFQADVAKDGLRNATAIGAGAIATTSNMVRIGNESVTLIQGQVPFSWVSDRRWKTDVEPLRLGLDFVRRLLPVSYRLKRGNGRLDMGFVAQDVEEVLGDGYNVVTRGDDDQQLLSMRYSDLVAPLVRAVQEVDAEQRSVAETLTELRAENLALRREVATLRAGLQERDAESRARLDRLEQALAGVAAPPASTSGARHR